MSQGQQLAATLQENMKKVIVGKDDVIELILIALIARGHVLIEDVPGVGKTTLVSSLAKSLSCSFRRVQFTPDVIPSDITGFTMADLKTGEFSFRPGMIMSQIVLADEINRTSPKTQSSLLEAMEERQVTVDGTTYPLPAPFMVLATQNPIEYVGTYPLPEAQLDRFLMKIAIGYPTVDEEMQILSRFASASPMQALEAVASAEDIAALQEQAAEVLVSDDVSRYIVQIISRTRMHEDIALGVSPRGSLALLRAAQAAALLAGRDHVLPDDVQKVLLPVLSHRIVLRAEARLKSMTVEKVLKAILATVYVPGAADA